MTKRTLIALALLLIGTAQADIHKCIDADGRVVYTQAPCGPTLVVRTDQPSELTVMESRLRITQAKIDVAEHLAQQRAEQEDRARQQAIAKLESQRANELDDIEHQRASARRNLAGALELNALAIREQTVVDHYAAALATLTRAH